MIHRHPEAEGYDEELKFLKNLHYHDCKCEIWIEKIKEEEEYQPLAILDWIRSIVINKLSKDETISIDFLCELIKQNLDKVFLGSRKIKIRIWESDNIALECDYE